MPEASQEDTTVSDNGPRGGPVSGRSDFPRSGVLQTSCSEQVSPRKQTREEKSDAKRLNQSASKCCRSLQVHPELAFIFNRL